MVIVGQGEEKENLIQTANQLGISNKVLLVGPQNDIQGWLSCFDVFAFPSHYEGLSIAFIEAQANGIPCVVSENAKRTEALINNNNIVCIPNNMESWTGAIQKVRQNDMRLAKEEIVHNFSRTRFSIKSEAIKLQEEFC